MKDAKGHGSDPRGGSGHTPEPPFVSRFAGKGVNYLEPNDPRGAAARAAHQSGVNSVGQRPLLPPESATSRELRLFADNDGDLNRQSFVPVVNNLSKKIDKGVYDPDKATKLFGYHADKAAQAYTKQFGGAGDKWHEMFPPAVRREAAAHWQQEVGPRIKRGEFK